MVRNICCEYLVSQQLVLTMAVVLVDQGTYKMCWSSGTLGRADSIIERIVGRDGLARRAGDRVDGRQGHDATG